MGAPIVTVFLPDKCEYNSLLDYIVHQLSLHVDELPPGFPFSFCAQTLGRDYFLVQFDNDSLEIIEEMLLWDKPTDSYKKLLADCKPSINIHYRNIDFAKQCLLVVAKFLDKLSCISIFENGLGCLLLLSDVSESLASDSTWTWERQTFSDIPGVADSEWLE
ncbi:MAG: hypothetical protein R3B84_24890 [Zavarzinella sp.]